ncbi:MAG: hypothetical protein WBG36_10215 [Ornithinimicrobium sp.]
MGEATLPPAVGHTRRYRASPSILVASAALSVISGGLVAAVTGPLGLDRGSWLAAYLVLVCGVGGWSVGVMQRGGVAGMSPLWARAQLAAWAVGNTAVIIGSLSLTTLSVDAGVVLLEMALLIAFITAPAVAAVGRASGWGYRALLILLMVSAPVGSVLSRL